MTDETKSKITAVVDGTKHHAWKWLGALIMEPKEDGNGGTTMAVSMSKLQKLTSLAMAVVLFAVMLGLWVAKPETVAETASVTDPIPDSMLYTLWGLLGFAGVNQIASAMASKTGAKD
jgi:hypothetical protein